MNKKQTKLRELSLNEITEQLDSEELQLQKLKLSHVISPIENPCKLKECRKSIARLKTEIRRRELENK